MPHESECRKFRSYLLRVDLVVKLEHQQHALLDQLQRQRFLGAVASGDGQLPTAGLLFEDQSTNQPRRGKQRPDRERGEKKKKKQNISAPYRQ